MVEDLSKSILNALHISVFKGINIGGQFRLTHLQFINCILIFCVGLRRDVEKLAKNIDLYSTATYIKINVKKSSISREGTE